MGPAQVEKDRIQFMRMLEPGYAPTQKDLFYGWGVTTATHERKRTRADGTTQYETSSIYSFLLLPRSAGEQARKDWQDHLAEAYLEVKNSRGLPIELAEANFFTQKLRGVLGNEKTIENYDLPLRKAEARAIADFLVPRLEIAVHLTAPNRLVVALATIDQHLHTLSSV